MVIFDKLPLELQAGVSTLMREMKKSGGVYKLSPHEFSPHRAILDVGIDLGFVSREFDGAYLVYALLDKGREHASKSAKSA